MTRLTRRTFLVAAAATAAPCALLASAAAAEEVRWTGIRVRDMHCPTCASKIARRLYTVQGVVQVKTSVEKNVAWVYHQLDRDPSPRLLWEAVEAAGFTPVKMEGPGGSFTDKPKV